MLQRWNRTWVGLGVDPPPEIKHLKLIAARCTPGRNYGTIDRLKEQLELLDTIECVEHRHEVELAAWYYHANWTPLDDSCLRKNADWCMDDTTEAKVNFDSIERIDNLIMALERLPILKHPDEAILCDLHSSIFGAPRDRFIEAMQQHRADMAGLGDAEYRVIMITSMENLLGNWRLFLTREFRKRFEEQAKDNASYLLSELQRQI